MNCQRQPARWAAFTLILLGVSLCAVGSVQAQVTEASVASGRDSNPSGLLSIELRADIRVFTVMAAATVAGFGNGHEERLDMEMVRSIREDLKGLDEGLLDRLRVMFAARSMGGDEAQHTAYTSLALLLTGPPDFRLAPNAPEIPPDVKQVLGFEELLSEFYRKGRIETLWEKYRPACSREIEAYDPIVRRVIQSTLDYFRIPPRVVLDRSIVIMPDLFGFRNVVHARNLERVYYIVVGPAEDHEANAQELQHEYLHFLLDPMMEKQASEVLKLRSLLALAEQQPNVGRDFRGRFLLLLTESLVEAVMHRLHPPDDLDTAKLELFRKGLVFAPYFLRSLAAYEGQSEKPFPVFLADSLGAISEEEIERDAEAVALVEAEQQRAAQLEADRRQAKLEQQQAAVDEANRKVRLLREAGDLMAAREWTVARLRLEELLRADPENGDALFYLGQIAAQQQDHEGAVDYYRRAEAAPGSKPWVKAWCSVRIGRFLANDGNFDEARSRFEAVIAAGEEFNGARQAAQESLQALPPPGR